MKKVAILMIAVVLAAVFVACAEGSEQSEEKVTFSGTILELNGVNAIVEPFEGESIRGSADKISVNLSISDETFAVGDSVKIEYDGSVMESYPAQVNVLGVEKLD